MNDDQRRIIISKVSEFHQNENDGQRHVPISPVNRWLTYTLLIPVVVVMVLIGIFFFAAFLALLAVAIMVIGIRFWWVRRQYERAMQSSHDSDRKTTADPMIIEDAQIIEETETSRNKPRQ